MATINELELKNAQLRKDIAVSELAVAIASRGHTPADAVYFAKMVSSRVAPTKDGVRVTNRDGEEITIEELADEVSTLAKELAVSVPKTLVPGDRLDDGLETAEEPNYQGYGKHRKLRPPVKRIAPEDVAAAEAAAKKRAKVEATAAKNIAAGRYRGVAGL